jgi:hypothetical protein
MRSLSRIPLLASLLLLPSPAVFAQGAADPSGHWEGAVQVPNKEVKVEVDLAKNSKGKLAGTFGNPGEGLKGLPLATVSVEGRAVTFELKANNGGGTFHGILFPDGKSMSGEFITTEGGHSLPFSLTRTGDARLVPAPKSPPIGKELEGIWNGTLEFEGKQSRLVLSMVNQADGTATGTILSRDGSGIEVPIAMTQKASSVTIDVPSVSATYVGVLNAAGTELVGTWTQGPAVLPLTFRRAAK